MRKPKLLPNPDFTRLKNLCKEYLDEIASSGWLDDNAEEYMVEAALEALYGPTVLDYINEKAGKYG